MFNPLNLKIAGIGAIAGAAMAAYITWCIMTLWYDGKLKRQAEAARVEKNAAIVSEQTACADRAKLTENANAKHDQDFDAITARYNAAVQRVRANTAHPCVPVRNLADVHSQGTGALGPTGGNGIDAGHLLDFSRRAAERNKDFLNCRAFVISERGGK